MCMEAIAVASSDMLIISVGWITVYMHAENHMFPSRPTTRPPRPDLPVPGACPCSEQKCVHRGPAARRTRSSASRRSLSRPREEEEEEEVLMTSCCTGAARAGRGASGSRPPRAGTLCRLSRAMQVSNPYDHSA